MSILDWLLRIFSIGRGILSLLGAVVFCVVLLNMSRPGKQTFHDVMVSTFLYPAQVSLSLVNRGVEVFSEHEALKIENAKFRLQVDFMRQELSSLPKQFEQAAWADSVSWRLKKASVVAEQPSRYATTWVINVGTSDSIDVNMPVLTSRGIVGKVVKAFGNHSLVQLITDANFRAAITCERTRARGILEFWKLGHLAARFPVGSEIKQGDTLITNGLGGVFPKGLLVGVLEADPEPDPDQADILLMAKVIPAENPNFVEEVFVLIRQSNYVITEAN